MRVPRPMMTCVWLDLVFVVFFLDWVVGFNGYGVVLEIWVEAACRMDQG